MIYFDNAATTCPNTESLKIFNEINAERYFNPSASYSVSFNLFKEIEGIRKDFISYLGGKESDKLIFTSGATESNNLAIFGSCKNKQKKYLFSMGEHPSVYNCAIELKNRGYDVEFIPLQKNGQVDYKKLSELCTPDVCFVSTMFVNNETGAINDLKQISKIIKEKSKDAIFHVDAVQGFGKIKFSVSENNIDLCSISAHKIGGIKGIGALYIAKNLNLKNINYGGGQEFGLRSGTVNAGAIFSFKKSAEIAFNNLQENLEVVSELKHYLNQKLEENFSNKIILVSAEDNSPYVNSIIFKDNRGETIMRYLDSRSILVGTGSACSSSKVGNRILENMGYNKKEVMGSVRVSFNANNTKQEIDVVVGALADYIKNINT